LLKTFARRVPEATFVQIGSNDGEQLDPLRRHILRRSWRGVMVEPVPIVFERLVANYGRRDRIALENVAIADRAGELPFHHLAPVEDFEAEGLPRWYDALGSFRRDVVLSHADRIPDIHERLVTTAVPCTTFDALCTKHGIGRLDLLHIDTEGYDFEILKSIDWSRWRPLLLIYEHLHLSLDERAACQSFLADQGYGAMEEHMDTWCVDLRGEQSPAAELQRLVLRHSPDRARAGR
jgi:FkbM family methyltransferase